MTAQGERPPTNALLPLMTESQWQHHVIHLAKGFGWATYHTRFSIGSDSGWPDLALVKPGEEVIYVELKREGKKKDIEPTALQQMWLDRLASALGTKVFVWRPRDSTEIVSILSGGRAKVML